MGPAGDDVESSSAVAGLSAADVAERVARGEVNTVAEAPTRTIGEIVRANVFTPINLIIAVLAGLVILAGSPKDALFAGVIVANSVIGVVQEVRAKRTLDALALITAPRAHVIRDGAEHELAVDELVLDDIVALRTGAQVVADGEIVSADNLEIDESLLTGEADSVDKRVGDEVLSGSAVVAGTALMRVTKVGADNYAARLAEEARRFTLVNSALRKDINRIVTTIGWLIIPIGLLLASSQFLRTDEGWREAVIGTVAGLVGMVPEGLVLLTSVAFAVGVVRLGRKRCLVQELPAIEVLARVDVLCADKTGTITEGALELAAVEPLDADEDDVGQVLAAMASLDPDPNSTMQAVARARPEAPGWTLEDRVPFSSARKWSAMTFTDWGRWVFGAPEMVFAEASTAEIDEAVRRHAADGRRVLALARAEIDDSGDDASLREVEPAALVLFDDIIRPDAPSTLEYFATQDVTLKVISGDNDVTVGAVARRAGLEGWESSVDARTLPDADDPAFAEAVETNTVFGRVSPHQKREMVKALQAKGHVVAMTGDGVNDVLALKDADCGIAMASGSDASRGVAQMVLMDSNFSALPSVVSEGRRVINNIERVASLFLAKTTYSIILSLLTGVLAISYPLRPIHLSIISWFTIGVPAFFLALEPNDERVESGFLHRVLRRAVPAGVVIALLTVTAYGLVRTWADGTIDEARSVALLVAGAAALTNLARVARPYNRWRLILVATMVVMFGTAFVVPFTRDLFELPVAPAESYVVAAAFAAIAWPLMALGDHVARRVEAHRRGGD